MNYVALRPEHLNLISICTGGGGLDLGVELAIPSARSVCMVEREAFAVATLVAAMEQGLLHPAPVWSDARTFDGRAWRGAVDGLIGGIPCQPHSHAGKREGQNDERDLWSPTRKIIVNSRPWLVLIENVGGMLTAKEGLDPGAFRVWRDLQRLGFDVEAGLFTAEEVGATHERERIFILGVSGVGQADTFCSGFQGSTRREVRDEQPSAERGGEDLVDAQGIGRGERRTQSKLRSGWNSASGSERSVDDASIARGRTISVQPRRQGEAGNDLNRAGLFPPGPNDLQRWRDILEGSPELEPAFRRVADGLASRMDIGRVDRLRMLGNGVVPLQAGYAIRTLAYRLAQRGHDRLWKLCQ